MQELFTTICYCSYLTAQCLQVNQLLLDFSLTLQYLIDYTVCQHLRLTLLCTIYIYTYEDTGLTYMCYQHKTVIRLPIALVPDELRASLISFLIFSRVWFN